MSDVEFTYQQKVADYLVAFQGYYSGLLETSEATLKGLVMAAENEVIGHFNSQAPIRSSMQEVLGRIDNVNVKASFQSSYNALLTQSAVGHLISDLENGIATKNQILSSLDGLAKYARYSGYVISAAQLALAVDSGNSELIGKVVAGAIVGLAAEVIAAAVVETFAVGATTIIGATLVVGAVLTAGVMVNNYMNANPDLAEAIGDNFKNLMDGASEVYNSLEWSDLTNLLTGEGVFLPSSLIGAYYIAAGIAQLLKDPLALDLNHDGAITTISADDGITFDHAASGVEYGTGWLNADDAWLALDVNGNGVIDSGRELFGDNTIKLDGNRAKDAFDALASFDANGDGKVDIADATGDTDLDGVMEAGETYWDMNHNGVYDASTDKTFADLRLWKDADSNGNTDAGELLTLASQHVVSISTGKTAANVADNENLKTGTGSYTTDLDANNDSIADTYGTAQFNLTENAFFRVFATTPTVSSAIAALPNMQGSGAVLDLQEAMAA